MATHRISILQTILPDSANVRFTPYNLEATNDAWKHPVLVFDGSLSTRDGGYGVFDVPQNYVGTAKIIVQWTSTATSGDVEWDFDYRSVGGDDTESLDQSGTQESVNQNDTAPSAVHERMTATLTLTSGNFTAGDTVEFGFFRDQVDAGDTMAAKALVHDLLFEYADA